MKKIVSIVNENRYGKNGVKMLEVFKVTLNHGTDQELFVHSVKQEDETMQRYLHTKPETVREFLEETLSVGHSISDEVYSNEDKLMAKFEQIINS